MIFIVVNKLNNTILLCLAETNTFIVVSQFSYTTGCPVLKLIVRSFIIDSPDIMTGKSRRSRWAGHLVRMIMCFACVSHYTVGLCDGETLCFLEGTSCILLCVCVCVLLS